MKTIQEYLQEDEQRFLAEIEKAEDFDHVEKVCEEELHRMITQYNSQNISDSERRSVQYLLEIVKLSLPFMDSVADVRIYSRSEYSSDKADTKISKPLLFLATGCAVASLVILVIFAGSLLKIPAMLVGIALAALAMFLFFLCGKSVTGTTKKPELSTELKPDAKKIYQVFSAIAYRCDYMLNEMKKSEAHAVTASKVSDEDPAILQYFSDLLESVYSEEQSELTAEIKSQTEYYLHTKGIEVNGNFQEHPEWFDSMPGKPAVLRPALIRENKVVSRGLATGVKR